MEVVEDLAVAFAFLEDDPPGEAGLGPFEADHFEEMAGVAGGDAPFGVVIFAVKVEVCGQPGAAGFSIAHVWRLLPDGRVGQG